MRTPICDILDIEVPIIQGAIGGITCPELASAVSGAGGLGTIAMTGYGADGTRAAVERTRAFSNRSFAANFVLGYDVEAEITASLELGVPLISLFWGDPTPHVQRVHHAGAKLMMSVGSVDEARRAADAGVDVIVAQGWEAGGHVRGTVANLALIPRVVDEVAPLPVVAAGGIADGRGLAAVLGLGAQAAWIGTRFLAAEEAVTHPHYQSRVLGAEAADTYYSNLYDVGWPDAPGRVLRNSTIDAWEEAGRPPPGDRPGEGETIVGAGEDDQVLRYEAVAARCDYQGDVEAMPLWAGQGVGLVRRCQPAAEIVSEIVAEAEAVIAALARL
jgi:NAD(P)H-dependent flavin oxidoreductase YrpB (nitropropane dioxygenase family)